MDANYSNKRFGCILIICVIAIWCVACSVADTNAVRIAIEEQDGMLHIKLVNQSASALKVPKNFLDKSRRHALALVVVSSDGIEIPMCDGIDYVHGPDIQVISPGGSAEIVVPISAVKIAYCLDIGARYRVRAVFQGGAQSAVEPAVSRLVEFAPD